jgi:hypothetical protein
MSQLNLEDLALLEKELYIRKNTDDETINNTFESGLKIIENNFKFRHEGGDYVYNQYKNRIKENQLNKYKDIKKYLDEKRSQGDTSFLENGEFLNLVKQNQSKIESSITEKEIELNNMIQNKPKAETAGQRFFSLVTFSKNNATKAKDDYDSKMADLKNNINTLKSILIDIDELLPIYADTESDKTPTDIKDNTPVTGGKSRRNKKTRKTRKVLQKYKK